MAISPEPQIQKFAVDADPKLIWQTIDQDGAAIIKGVLPLDVVKRFNKEVEPRVQTWENPAKGDFSPHTKFMNGLVSASEVYRQEILNNEAFHRLCEAAFERTGDYWLVSAVLRLTQPGHPAQVWHRDANGWPLVKHQRLDAPPITITVIIPMTDFTAANGATRVHLGSHNWPSVDVPSDARPAIALSGPGDMLVMRQGIVHSGGDHTSEAPDTRSMLLLSVATCQLTQYESALTLPRSLVESLSTTAQKLVGWRTVFPLNHPMGLNTFRSGLVEEKLGLKSNQPFDKAIDL